MRLWAKSTNSGYNYQNKTFFSLSPTEEDKKSKALRITRASGSDGNPVVLIKVNHEGESVATLNVGEARVSSGNC
ncbi:hypothetical protein PF010_g20204 [Phytophthora fragariae]|uniref:Uncharacterized protein n=1 Tax=Phytophthora fragariae TaxID=53985 RepID=A0A6A4CFZ8_9STRA|nr:hypothetical protein PF009_g21918 [Phytophthora fragariae]KAE9086143.1 hypothetical protein PF010_g20204 [Phytophthora fragariae]KAE9199819.1 hypothetical protein PF002_g22025 [Phytophthora fragariae]KAE9289697.1 hypothetical protein PF001_g19917 [Phytophthora fragariae]